MYKIRVQPSRRGGEMIIEPSGRERKEIRVLLFILCYRREEEGKGRGRAAPERKRHRREKVELGLGFFDIYM